jgi:hypothetical protein
MRMGETTLGLGLLEDLGHLKAQGGLQKNKI